jgi:hypothetical protein
LCTWSVQELDNQRVYRDVLDDMCSATSLRTLNVRHRNYLSCPRNFVFEFLWSVYVWERKWQPLRLRLFV